MLVLAPTRELALQSAEVIAEAGKHCGIRSTCVYGGVPKREQRIALGGGRGEGNSVEVVVATPGRLKDLVGEGVCDLSRVRPAALELCWTEDIETPSRTLNAMPDQPFEFE